MRWFAFLAMLVLAAPAMADEFLIIAHRGASAERPEHTLAAYAMAIDQGADYIEPDLVATRDGVLVARHENEISETTDVAERAEFAERKATKLIDGRSVTGWFTEDFTLAELQTLRAKERLPELRADNTRFDGLYQVPTLDEILKLVREKEAEAGRTIGLYPEIKHPTYFMQAGYDLAALLVEQLHGAGYRGEDAPVFIQSFEVEPLRRLNAMTDIRLVQLMSAAGGPADQPEISYAEMLSDAGLAQIAAYADGIGAHWALIVPEHETTQTDLVARAHAKGLLVHVWTLRPEPEFLPGWAASSDRRLFLTLYHAQADGVFADSPRRAAAFRARARPSP